MIFLELETNHGFLVLFIFRDEQLEKNVLIHHYREDLEIRA